MPEADHRQAHERREIRRHPAGTTHASRVEHVPGARRPRSPCACGARCDLPPSPRPRCASARSALPAIAPARAADSPGAGLTTSLDARRLASPPPSPPGPPACLRPLSPLSRCAAPHEPASGSRALHLAAPAPSNRPRTRRKPPVLRRLTTLTITLIPAATYSPASLHSEYHRRGEA